MKRFHWFLITVLGGLLLFAPGAFAKGKKAKHNGRTARHRAAAPKPRKIKAVNPYKKTVKPYHNPVR
jgi:hypothetical protein